MKDFFSKALRFCNYYKNAFRYFWKYAIGAKLRTRKYKSCKVIMLRLDFIGDCTMFTSAAIAIRQAYQDREVTLVCLSITRPIFERLGIFDKIITVNFKPHIIDFDTLEKLITEIRCDEYDILLQPQISKYPLVDILAAAIKCNKRISIRPKADNSSTKWIKMTNFLWDKFFPYTPGIVSEFVYYGDFVRGIIPDYKTTMPKLPHVSQNFISDDYYVLFPGGSSSQRLWPPERFAQIADYIYKKNGLLGVILGVESEQWVSDRLKANLHDANIIDLTGKTTLTDVIDIIGNAEFVVTNDTSGVHIAAATGTPSVANAGGWYFNRFLPYHIEDLRLGDCLPLVTNTKMHCYYCGGNRSVIKRKNPECFRRFKNDELRECIFNIGYEQMRELVDVLI